MLVPTAGLPATSERGRRIRYSGERVGEDAGMPPDPPTVPLGWRVLHRAEDGQALAGMGPERQLQVIWSDAIELDDKWWRHVSVSVPGAASGRHRALPRWLELHWVHRHFVGPDRFSYQVHAPAVAHVSLREVLHIWACMEGPTGQLLPDFTRGQHTI